MPTNNQLQVVCPQAVLNRKLVKSAAPGKGVFPKYQKAAFQKMKTPANRTRWKALNFPQRKIHGRVAMKSSYKALWCGRRAYYREILLQAIILHNSKGRNS